ncbi:hypothetical protein M422DRAFT_264334 [Sphaerobolus stellatus SS14]|uniref:Uncharacterized protein n=1 Tax=Sphaerobolus stellatus (strain SS14) TaxID=990650 RepID=A0A0C9V8Q8_SPHS4|nr:hypothetical protein M422DRAFT_264334 [Sphaerobolus stellatus SS14]
MTDVEPEPCWKNWSIVGRGELWGSPVCHFYGYGSIPLIQFALKALRTLFDFDCGGGRVGLVYSGGGSQLLGDCFAVSRGKWLAQLQWAKPTVSYFKKEFVAKEASAAIWVLNTSAELDVILSAIGYISEAPWIQSDQEATKSILDLVDQSVQSIPDLQSRITCFKGVLQLKAGNSFKKAVTDCLEIMPELVENDPAIKVFSQLIPHNWHSDNSFVETIIDFEQIGSSDLQWLSNILPYISSGYTTKESPARVSIAFQLNLKCLRSNSEGIVDNGILTLGALLKPLSEAVNYADDESEDSDQIECIIPTNETWQPQFWTTLRDVLGETRNLSNLKDADGHFLGNASAYIQVVISRSDNGKKNQGSAKLRMVLLCLRLILSLSSAPLTPHLEALLISLWSWAYDMAGSEDFIVSPLVHSLRKRYNIIPHPDLILALDQFTKGPTGENIDYLVLLGIMDWSDQVLPSNIPPTIWSLPAFAKQLRKVDGATRRNSSQALLRAVPEEDFFLDFQWWLVVDWTPVVQYANLLASLAESPEWKDCILDDPHVERLGTMVTAFNQVYRWSGIEVLFWCYLGKLQLRLKPRDAMKTNLDQLQNSIAQVAVSLDTFIWDWDRLLRNAYLLDAAGVLEESELGKNTAEKLKGDLSEILERLESQSPEGHGEKAPSNTHTPAVKVEGASAIDEDKEVIKKLKELLTRLNDRPPKESSGQTANTRTTPQNIV